MIKFIIGMVVGAFLGMATIVFMVAASDRNDHEG